MKIPRTFIRERWGMILILVGVCAWIPYGVMKYGFDMDVEVLRFLVWHLAGVVPGFLMRRWGLLRRIVPGKKHPW